MRRCDGVCLGRSSSFFRASESNVRQVSADPSTFCFGFAWWLADFQGFPCAKFFLAGGNLCSLFFTGSVGDVSAVFCLWIRMVWARNLLGFAVRQRFWKLIQLLMRFVSNISALFVVAVSHGLGTKPAAVRRFRKRSAKGLGRSFLIFDIS